MQSVITVHGMCASHSNAAKGASSCDKVITRADFEKLLEALNPSHQTIPDTGLQNLARTYAEFLALEAAARNSGLEDTPEFREALEFVRLRTAADLYRRSLVEKFRTPPQEEIDAYYKQHVADYERVKLSRVLVPRVNSAAADTATFEKKAMDAATAARDRLLKGDDPAQVEKDAYAALGLQSPPPTEVGNYGRNMLVEKEGADVFALTPGGVTQVETEIGNYVVYKVTSKETLTEDQVKAEISREIAQKKLKDAIQTANDSAHADFNEQYFGAGIKSPPVMNVPLPTRAPH